MVGMCIEARLDEQVGALGGFSFMPMEQPDSDLGHVSLKYNSRELSLGHAPSRASASSTRRCDSVDKVR